MPTEHNQENFMKLLENQRQYVEDEVVLLAHLCRQGWGDFLETIASQEVAGKARLWAETFNHTLESIKPLAKKLLHLASGNYMKMA